jgi:hypothetical protein
VHASKELLDRGVATPVEMMSMVVFCLLAVVFLSFTGRLHAAAVQVTNTAQSAARSASMAHDPASARAAASRSVLSSPLATRCVKGPRASVTWKASSAGTWQGGVVTVTVSCTVSNQSLTGLWSPGTRIVSMRDSQVVDRYRR